MHTTHPAEFAPTHTSEVPESGISELQHLGIIRVAGTDAVHFLQGQLTQDIALLGQSQARLAAFCNAKGRMQASFVVFKRSDEEVLLVCHRDILAQTLKRLSMFVLRAKVRLTDATGDFVLAGLTGNAITSIAGSPLNTWSRADFDAKTVIGLHPTCGTTRALWCAPSGTALPAAPSLDIGTWQWLAVRSGIAMITLPVFEAFVPQMLNYESVGGVSFKKGCYPGQEIVARSQFRGTLKRRAYLAHGAEPMAAGQEIFHAGDREQPCGLVAQAAAHPSGGFDAVVSLQTAAAGDAADGKLTLGSAAGPALSLLPLPYPLLEDI
ncbi:MAG: hypothetical protein JWP47_2618 [Polaromonas sp.]|nr:hypothetical protein [Polaromonas sp.]